MVNVRTTIQTSTITEKPTTSAPTSTFMTTKPITSTVSTQPRCFTGNNFLNSYFGIK